MGRPRRCGCCAAAASTRIDVNRLVATVGPQDSARTVDVHDWVLRSSQHGVYGAFIPTDTPSNATVTVGGTTYNVIRRFMKPIRFACKAFGGPTGNRFGFSSPESIALAEVQNRFGSSDILPPATSHMDPFNLTGITIPVQAGTQPNFSSASGGIQQTIQLKCSHYRIYVDSVDVTGIIEVPNGGVLLPVSWSGNRDTVPQFLGYSLASIGHSLTTPISASGLLIEFDLWFELQVPELTWNVDVIRTINSAMNRNNDTIFGYVTASYGDGDNNRSPTDKYKLTFANNGPAGGITELVLENQAGWSAMVRNNVHLSFRHDSTGDEVYFTWGREWPEVGIYKPSLGVTNTYPPNIPLVRYYPQNSNDYPEAYVYSFGSTIGPFRYGVWNPQAPTTFIQQGRLTGNPTNNFSWFNSFVGSTSYFPNFPTSITVEKV